MSRVGSGWSCSPGCCLPQVLWPISEAWKGDLIERGVEQVSFRQVCDFLRMHESSAGLVISWNPRVLGLYTNLPSAWYPFIAQDAAFDDYLARVHANYVLVYLDSEDDRRWLLPHLESRPQLFPVLFHNSDFLHSTPWISRENHGKQPYSVMPPERDPLRGLLTESQKQASRGRRRLLSKLGVGDQRNGNRAGHPTLAELLRSKTGEF